MWHVTSMLEYSVKMSKDYHTNYWMRVKKLAHELRIQLSLWNIGSRTDSLVELVDILIRRASILCVQETKWICWGYKF